MDPNKVRGLGLINTIMELTKVGRIRGLKELYFSWNVNAMMLNEATNPKQTRKVVPELGLGISRDSIVGIASNFGDL